jgi:hypothetical protein
MFFGTERAHFKLSHYLLRGTDRCAIQDVIHSEAF